MSDERSVSEAGNSSPDNAVGEERVTAANYRISELARFRILSGGLCTSICYSTFYTYNLTTNYMTNKYGFGSKALTTISTTGSVVGYFTFPYGILLDAAGPTPVLTLSTIFASLGSLLFGIAYDDKISGSVVSFSVFFSIMAIGCTGFDNGSQVVVMSNFPLNRGPTVAIMKTLGGLGAGILGAIKLSVLGDDPMVFMYFMAALLFTLGSIGVALIRFPKFHITPLEKRCINPTRQRRLRLTERAYMTQRAPAIRFLLGVIMVVLLLIYLTVQSLAFAYAENATRKQRLIVTIILIVMIVFMIVSVALPLPFLGGMDVPPSKHLPELEDDVAEEELSRVEAGGQPGNVVGKEPMADGSAELLDDGLENTPAAGRTRAAPTHNESEAVDDQLIAEAALDPQYQTTFFHSIRRPELWCLWWNCFVTWGGGLVITLNAAQIYRSLNMNEYDSTTNTMYTAIIGVGNALGRLTVGGIETMLVRLSPERRPPITAIVPGASTSMLIGLIFLLALPERSKVIVIGFFLEAFGNGFAWACTAITIRTLFAKDIGKHYSFMGSSIMVSIICLNRFGFGELYDREAKQQRDSGMFDPPIYPRCSGKKCVLYSLILLLCINVTSICAGIFLHFRYRRFSIRHKQKLAEAARLREAEQESQAPGGNSGDINLVEPLSLSGNNEDNVKAAA